MFIFPKDILENSFFIFVFTIAIFIIAVSNSIGIFPQHYTYFALSLLEGHLDIHGISSLHNQIEMTVYLGKQYVVWSFFPALLCIPFVLFWGNNFKQEYLMPLLLAILIYILFIITKNLGFSKRDSIWLISMYIIGSSFWGLLIFPVSDSLLHFLGSIFLFLSLYFFLKLYQNKTKIYYWVYIGIFLGLAILTRITFIWGVLFYIGYIFGEGSSNSKLKSLLYFFIGVVFNIGLYGLYNYLRFSSFFEFGYGYQLSVINYTDASFGLRYVLKNAYVFFLRPPQIIWENVAILVKPFIIIPNSGMGFIFTSFSFFLVFTKRSFQNSRLVKYLLISPIVGLLFLFLWFHHGGVQFGYRFFLDYQPFLYLLILFKLSSHINTKDKLVIGANIVSNLLLSLGFIITLYATTLF